jgi:hypothetical protein
MAEEVLAHWHTRIDSFSYSSNEFYEHLAAELERREMPRVKIKRKRQPEFGLFSARREYLRVRRGHLTLAICAAPFGIDYFVSSWLLEPLGCLGTILTFIFPTFEYQRRLTYYQEDTAIIFHDAVHEVVLHTIETVLKGVDRTFEGDRKPVRRSRLLK